MRTVRSLVSKEAWSSGIALLAMDGPGRFLQGRVASTRYERVGSTPSKGKLQGSTQSIPEERALVKRRSSGKKVPYNPKPKLKPNLTLA